MLNKTTVSLLHRKWHRRVEGQIRNCVNAHPEWFQGDTNRMINSLAKRIVGEIVAGLELAQSHHSDGSCLDEDS